MVLKLPNRPNLNHLKNQAKNILKAHRRKDAGCCRFLKVLDRRIRGTNPGKPLTNKEILEYDLKLTEAQYALALNYGYKSWDALKKSIQSQRGENIVAEIKKKNGKVWIENIPLLGWGKTGENTFAGGLSSALSVTEHPYKYSQLMGYSGLAFRLRWYRRTDEPDWCPSSPVGEFPDEIRAVEELTGWKFFEEARMGKEHSTMEDLADKMTATIDNGLPALGMAKGNLDTCVLHGYEKTGDGIKLLWDSYWWDKPAPVAPEEVGPWLLILNDYKQPVDERQKFLQALNSNNWRRKEMTAWGDGMGKECKYHYGDTAFEIWINDIRDAGKFTGEQQQKLFFVNWWVFDCLWDARNQAANYLSDNSAILGEDVEPMLKKAADYYRNATGLMNSAMEKKESFYGPWTGKKFEDWDAETREKEAGLLTKVWELDKKAVREIDKALKEFESRAV
ncbi:MAG: hypothetical protein GF307_02585 [candidate division Zixibacteria bacterium]|nr:hypothetical protein [candidate division Zixibacteria bacterium]